MFKILEFIVTPNPKHLSQRVIYCSLCGVKWNPSVVEVWLNVCPENDNA